MSSKTYYFFPALIWNIDIWRWNLRQKILCCLLEVCPILNLIVLLPSDFALKNYRVCVCFCFRFVFHFFARTMPVKYTHINREFKNNNNSNDNTNRIGLHWSLQRYYWNVFCNLPAPLILPRVLIVIPRQFFGVEQNCKYCNSNIFPLETVYIDLKWSKNTSKPQKWSKFLRSWTGPRLKIQGDKGDVTS